MAVQALTASVIIINDVDYSNRAKSVTLTVDAAQLDTTTMASDGWVEMIGGNKSGTLAVEFLDDVAASKIDAELWAILNTVVTFKVRLDDAVVGTSNPEYQGSVLITQHNIGGSQGELASKSLSFPTSGAVTRATS